MSDEEMHQNNNSRKKSPGQDQQQQKDVSNSVTNGTSGGEEKVAATVATNASFLSELMKRGGADKGGLANSSILGMLMSRGREQGGDGEVACDFLANMLGIGDQGLLVKAFQSPEEAAKLLGVEK